MSDKALERILCKGSAENCIRFFQSLDETARRAAAPIVREHLLAAAESGNDLWDCASLAALASASLGELKKLGWRVRLFDRPATLAILRDRRPPWLTEYFAWLLDQGHAHHWPVVRQLVRDGVCQAPDTEGYVLGMVTSLGARGSVAEDLLADPELLDDLVWRVFEVEGGGEHSLAARDKYSNPERTWSVALQTLAQRGKLDRERLLDASLDALNRDFAQFRAGWFSRFHEALAPTVEDRAARTERYHDLLASPIAPTVSMALKALKVLHKAGKLDHRAFVARVEPALYAKGKSSATAALKILSDIAKAAPELRQAAMRAAAGALEHPETDVQGLALGMIEDRGDPADEALRAAVAERLTIVSASLRGRAEAWLGDRSGLPGAASEPAGLEEPPDLSARARSLPGDWARLAGVDVALEEMDRLAGLLPAAPFTGLEIPRLSPEAGLQPVATFDALLDLFLEAIEQPNDVERLELILDGLARLADQRPVDFERRTGPLAKRIDTLRRRHGEAAEWGGPLETLMVLADAWLHGKVFDLRLDRRGAPFCETVAQDGSAGRLDLVGLCIDGVFFLRAVHVARLVAGRSPAGLLSTPSHRGGWVRPLTLVERSLARRKGGPEPDLADQVLALLRLAPDGRTAALHMARPVEGEWGAALRYALGGEAEKVGACAPLWVASARARAPALDDATVEKKFPGLGPDAGTAARYDYGIKVDKRPDFTWYRLEIACKPDPLRLGKAQSGEISGQFVSTVTAKRYPGQAVWLPTVLAHSLPRWFYHGEPLAARTLRSSWGPTLWPSNQEPLFACGALDTASFDQESRPGAMPPPAGFQVMLDPDVPMTPMARLMLSMGLNARDAAEGQMATDALIAVLEDGRLDGPGLGEAMRGPLFTGMIKPKRWVARLREAATVSTLHGQSIRQAVEGALQGDPGQAPRDIHALMELLRELCIEAGEALSDPVTREFLQGIGGGGKAAKLARTLLALEAGDSAVYRRAAAAAALAARVARAERWMAAAGDPAEATTAPRKHGRSAA